VGRGLFVPGGRREGIFVPGWREGYLFQQGEGRGYLFQEGGRGPTVGGGSLSIIENYA